MWSTEGKNREGNVVPSKVFGCKSTAFLHNSQHFVRNIYVLLHKNGVKCAKIIRFEIHVYQFLHIFLQIV